MTSPLKILLKDLYELSRRPNLFLWLTFAAITFLLIAGNLRTHDGGLRVLLIAPPHSKFADSVEQVVREFSDLEVMRKPGVRDVRSDMEDEASDLAIVWDDGWVVYDGSRPGAQQSEIRQEAQEIAIAIRACMPWHIILADALYGGALAQSSNGTRKDPHAPECSAESPAPNAGNPPPAPGAMDAHSPPEHVQESWSFVPVIQLHRAGDAVERWLVPAFLALLTLFVPFLLACNSLAREQELGALEGLIVTPGISWPVLVIGKALLPILAGMGLFGILLLFAQGWFALPIRPGLSDIAALYLMGVVVSALYGLLAASVIRNQLQGYFASAGYLLALILLTGFLYPREQSAAVVQFIAPALPLTWTYDPLSKWLLAGISSGGLNIAFLALALQIVGLTALTAIGLRFARMRI